MISILHAVVLAATCIRIEHNAVQFLGALIQSKYNKKVIWSDPSNQETHGQNLRFNS